MLVVCSLWVFLVMGFGCGVCVVVVLLVVVVCVGVWCVCWGWVFVGRVVEWGDSLCATDKILQLIRIKN